MNTGFCAESIKIMGEKIGINSQTLSDDAARKISEDVTDKVKILICDALKFMHHSKRNRLTKDDIERAMKLHKLEPLYGHEQAAVEPFRFAAGGGRELHFIEEKETNLEEIIKGTRPKVPLEVRLHTRWLAVDGQEPHKAAPNKVSNATVQANLAKLDLNLLTLSGVKQKNTNESFDKRGKSVVKAHKEICKSAFTSTIKFRNSEVVQVKQLVMHELSAEKQSYFKQLTDALISTDAHRRMQALNSLTADPGLFEICPRLCLFIAKGIQLNVSQHNLGALINLVRAVSALVNNPTLYIEKYLHELLPAVISCIVSRQVSDSPQTDAHWSLRTYAANLVARVCTMCGNSVNNLETRLMSIYNSGLEHPHMCLTTMYGALVGLCALGAKAVKLCIIPKLKIISQRIEYKIFIETPDALDKLTGDRIRTVISTYCSPLLAELRKAPDFVDDYRNDYGTCFATALCFGVLQARGSKSAATKAIAATSLPSMTPLTTDCLPNELANTLALPTQITAAAIAIPNRVLASNRATLPAATSRIPLTTRFPSSNIAVAVFPRARVQRLSQAVNRLETIEEEIIIIDDS